MSITTIKEKTKTKVKAVNPEPQFFIKKTVEESIVFNVVLLADTLKKKGDSLCQKLGITTQQWIIMLHLANDPNIPYLEGSTVGNKMLASELAEAINVSRPNITNLLNSLMEKGMVTQVESKDDRRKKFLSLTQKGWDIVLTIEPFRHKANKNLLIDLDDSEKVKFLQYINGCLDIIQG
jgi:DNA-binding MarR family transcriptional regulator